MFFPKFIKTNFNKSVPKTRIDGFGNIIGICDNLYIKGNDFISFANGTSRTITEFIPERCDRAVRTIIEPESSVGKFKNRKFVKGISIFIFETIKTVHMIKHYAHFCEHLLAIYGAIKNKNLMEENVENIFIIGDGNFPSKLENCWCGEKEINRHLISAIFHNAKVKFFNSHEFNGDLYQIEKAVVSDRAASAGTESVQHMNKFLALAAEDLAQISEIKRTHNSLRGSLLFYFFEKDYFEFKNKLVYIKRKTRRLSTKLEKELLSKIRKLNKFVVEEVEFENLSFKKQIEKIRNCQVLLGVHGNGLTHSVFMDPRATVIELFPKDVYRLDYRMFSELTGKKFISFSPSKEIKREDAYRIGEHGELSNSEIKKFNIEQIIAFLKTI